MLRKTRSTLFVLAVFQVTGASTLVPLSIDPEEGDTIETAENVEMSEGCLSYSRRRFSLVRLGLLPRTDDQVTTRSITLRMALQRTNSPFIAFRSKISSSICFLFPNCPTYGIKN